MRRGSSFGRTPMPRTRKGAHCLVHVVAPASGSIVCALQSFTRARWVIQWWSSRLQAIAALLQTLTCSHGGRPRQETEDAKARWVGAHVQRWCLICCWHVMAGTRARGCSTQSRRRRRCGNWCATPATRCWRAPPFRRCGAALLAVRALGLRFEFGFGFRLRVNVRVRVRVRPRLRI